MGCKVRCGNEPCSVWCQGFRRPIPHKRKPLVHACWEQCQPAHRHRERAKGSFSRWSPSGPLPPCLPWRRGWLNPEGGPGSGQAGSPASTHSYAAAGGHRWSRGLWPQHHRASLPQCRDFCWGVKGAPPPRGCRAQPPRAHLRPQDLCTCYSSS